MEKLIRLNSLDNILVLSCELEPGQAVFIGSKSASFAARIGLGHKLAARPIARGEKVVKYGVAIGSATVDIQAGEHVHLHNLKSDYIPTFLVGDGYDSNVNIKNKEDR